MAITVTVSETPTYVTVNETTNNVTLNQSDNILRHLFIKVSQHQELPTKLNYEKN